MKNLLLLVFSFAMIGLQAQPVTFATDVAPLVYSNCTPCHRAGEVGPMPFTNYQQVAQFGSMIAYVTQQRSMPPWKPDRNYSHFIGERGLSAADIQKLQDWVAQGKPRGDSTLEPPAPTFPTGSQLGTPNLVLSMSQTYTIQGNNTDEYRNFVIPSGLLQDRQIAAIEFRPGNGKVVHHALIGFDTTGTARRKDQQYAGYGYPGFGFNADVQGEFTGYTPGSQVLRYPSGIAKRLPANADIVVQIHYAPSPVSDTDRSSLNIFFAQGTVTRQAITYAANPYDFPNGANSFVIQPNTMPMFRAIRRVPYDISLMSVYPHAHLLGKSWKTYAVTPRNDTIPLIKIDDWDFNWQGSYTFPKFVKIPALSNIIVEATYDNTTNNPLNPSNPPRLVTWGEGTTDEMFLNYLTYVPYVTGDENRALGSKDLGVNSMTLSLKFYPNPVKGRGNIEFYLESSCVVQFQLVDVQGKVVKTFPKEVFSAGIQVKSLDFSGMAKGMYLLNMETAEGKGIQKIYVE